MEEHDDVLANSRRPYYLTQAIEHGSRQMTGWLSDIKSIIAVVAVAISICSLAISLRSSNTSRKALRIGQAQESRRLRGLSGNLINALFDLDDDYIYYEISISVSNPSDNPNAIASLELWVDYHKDVNHLTLRILARLRAGSFDLEVPARLESGNTVAGDIYFEVPRKLVQPNLIDGYHVAIIDTHQSVSSVDFSLARRQKIRRNDKGEAS